jgi:hypothetical protein
MRSVPVGDIFREVDEELRQERVEKLWKQYGKFVIAAAVLIVLGVAGWKFWQNQERDARIAEGAKFAEAAALLEAGKTAEAATAFAALAGETTSGYGILARLNEASIRVQAGDAAGAIDIYDSVAGDGGVPGSIRKLATVLAGLQALRVASIDLAAIESKLAPLTQAGEAYRYIALEILAVAAQKAGDIEKAKTQYKSIVEDPAAPTSVRSRASQMIGILGGN